MYSVLVILSLFSVLVVEVTSVDREDPGTPLFLTPLIESGKIREARARAFVPHHEMNDVISYSGYLTVNKNYNSNLFFWYFPVRIYTETAPVILWLQGGPGETSMLSLFGDHGPFSITCNKTLQRRDYSWYSDNYILYIDNPVGTGYSFTDNENGYARNVTQIARELLSALEQFFLLFPGLQNKNFFVFGESYAGKYVTALSYAIKNHNVKAKTKINLKGLAIVNGLCDPENQLLYSDYLYQIGLIDLNGKTEFQKYENATRKFIKQNNFIEAFNNYSKLFGTGSNYKLSLFYNLTGLQHYYNYIDANLNYDNFSNLISLVNEWIKKVDVRYAIHVGNTTFNLHNSIVLEYQKEDYLKSVVVLLQDLLEHYKVLIYNGQFDILYPYRLAVNYLQKMQWSGAEKYAVASRNVWFYENDLAGWTKSADNLKFVLVRDAGRMAFKDQPRWIYTETAPVVLWLQGGPGETSVLSLFEDHGPFSITCNKTLQRRDYSWYSDNYIIYIDNPVIIQDVPMCNNKRCTF